MSPRPIDRRTILRGAGVALALPWLESLAPRTARGQALARPRSFVAMSFPTGVADYWKPATTGAGAAWALSPILAPLAPVKSFVNVLQNVGNYGPFGAHIEPPNGNLTAALLTGTRPKPGVAAPSGVTCGTSVDQLIAQSLAGRTPLDSLQVGLSTLDSYTDGLPAACSRSISWRSPSQPTFKVVDPQAVFDHIVTSGGVLAAPVGSPLGTSRRAKNKSILDHVTNHASTVRGRLGRSDGVLMDQFLDSVRALETSVQTFPRCATGTRPTESFGVNSTPADYNRDTHANLMIDLVAMALACDVTRVVSFMLDDARSDFVYSFLTTRHFTAATSTPATGAVGGLNGLTRAGDTNDGWATVNFWFVDKLSRLCQKLLATPSGTATLLDDVTIFFGSEMHGANGDGLDLPIVTVGGGGGTLKTNQSIDFARTARQTERLANLHLTFLRGVFGLPTQTFGSAASFTAPGVPPNAFGAGTDVIPEILA